MPNNNIYYGNLGVIGSTGGGGTGSTVLNIQGTQGQLFSVVDGLTGSLMSVNDISGIPILEVFSDDRVVMGTYGDPGLTVSGTRVGIGGTSATGYTLDVSGATRVVGNLTITGSVTATVPTQNTYVAQGKLSGDQTITNGTDNVIQFVDDFDPNNWWSTSTYRLTPTVAGYYSIYLGAWFSDPGSSVSQYNIQARKNGNSFAICQVPGNMGGVGQGLGFSKVVYLNGTTDYVDFSAYQNTGTNKVLQFGTTDGSGTWYSAIFLGL